LMMGCNVRETFFEKRREREAHVPHSHGLRAWTRALRGILHTHGTKFCRVVYLLASLTQLMHEVGIIAHVFLHSAGTTRVLA